MSNDDFAGTNIYGYYYADITADTSTAITFIGPLMPEFIMEIEDVKDCMKYFQGFRDKNVFWFNHLKSGAARRLSGLCLEAVKEEQRAKTPRLQERERKVLVKPRATSCRKWTTGRPRK